MIVKTEYVSYSGNVGVDVGCPLLNGNTFTWSSLAASSVANHTSLFVASRLGTSVDLGGWLLRVITDSKLPAWTLLVRFLQLQGLHIQRIFRSS